jgi:formate hydrogenlyase transcriptional activator
MTMNSSAEIPRLRATVRDLLALSTIPEAWVGREPSAIAADLADLLVGSLELDFAFVRLSDPTKGQVVEVTRGNTWKAFPEWLRHHLAEFGQISRKEIVTNVGELEESIRGIVIPIGVNSERGFVAAASGRLDFPDQIDQQLLSVAANNAATAFQNAFLIKELRNAQEALRANEQELLQARDELEVKVAERTSELQRSEKELRDLLDSVPAVVWSALPDGSNSYVNGRFVQYCGMSPPQIAGSGWHAATHPDDLERHNAKWLACVSNGEPFEDEVRFRRADGQYRWHLQRGIPLRDEAGNIVKWYGVLTDIEERKRAEVELRRSQAHLRDAQRLSRTGSVGMKVSTKQLFWSDEAARIYGYAPGTEATADLVLQRVHPDDLDLLKSVLERAAQGGSAFDFEHRLLMPDGSIKHLRSLSHSLIDEAGNAEAVGAIMDITEHKVAEQRLQQQETELRQMLDLAPQLVAVYGPNRERLHVNRIALDYLGLSFEEWMQTPDRGAFVHPDDQALDREYFNRALSTGSAYELELRLRKGDGSYRWFLARLNPVRDDKGQIRRWYVACTDIEDRKRAEDKLKQENVALREEIDRASMFEEIVGTSPALQTVLLRISKVAPTDSTVLITGETGTGKELVARAIHRRSNRASRAFVSVNCAAIPRDLIASELFGHEKGAFTGAMQRRIGRFELAEGGTIFLDEVGELSADTQIALLRVLQEREIERVGGRQPIHVDVRVIAATNRDLKAAIAGGTFRQDLYYRLNVFPLEVPPLRERRNDTPLLVEYFIDRYARKAGKNIRSVDKKTLQLLQSYPWPGNIRELQNVIERSVIVCETENFSVDESWLSQQSPDERIGGKVYLSQKLAAKEKEVIEEALRESQGRVFGPSGAATKLGIARSTLESKIQSLNIDKNRFKVKPRS